MVEVHALTKRYGTFTAVDNLTYAFLRGRVSRGNQTAADRGGLGGRPRYVYRLSEVADRI